MFFLPKDGDISEESFVELTFGGREDIPEDSLWECGLEQEQKYHQIGDKGAKVQQEA